MTQTGCKMAWQEDRTELYRQNNVTIYDQLTWVPIDINDGSSKGRTAKLDSCYPASTKITASVSSELPLQNEQAGAPAQICIEPAAACTSFLTTAKIELVIILLSAEGQLSYLMMT